MSDESDAPGLLGWLGVVLLALVAGLFGLLETLLVPLYAGSTAVPVAVLLAVLSNILLPRMARTLVPTTPAAAVPLFAWLVVVIGFGVLARPEGDIILPGGSLQWVTYGVVLGGALAGTVSVVLSGPPAARSPRPSGSKSSRVSR